MDTPRATILYASLTGCNEDLAKELYQRLKAKGLSTKLIDAESADASDYLDADICLAVSYSYENYDEIIPDEMLEIYANLGEINLTGKVFGVLGTGQDIYDDFCGAVDKFERQFEKTGAIKGSESFKIEFELCEKEDEEKLDQFIDSIITTYHSLENQLVIQKA